MKPRQHFPLAGFRLSQDKPRPISQDQDIMTGEINNDPRVIALFLAVVTLAVLAGVWWDRRRLRRRR